MDPLDKILSVIVLNAIVIVSEETEEDMRRFASPVLYQQTNKYFIPGGKLAVPLFPSQKVLVKSIKKPREYPTFYRQTFLIPTYPYYIV